VLRYRVGRYRQGERRPSAVTAKESREGYVRDRLDRWADPPLLVLASLADEPKHGYAITQDVAETMGVRLSAGTLYAVISRLEARGLIEPLESEDRRRPYRITMAGAEALAQQSERMSKVAWVARERLSTRHGWAGA
jgi:DNA-binding PadR family transcriptional regulator